MPIEKRLRAAVRSEGAPGLDPNVVDEVLRRTPAVRSALSPSTAENEYYGVYFSARLRHKDGVFGLRLGEETGRAVRGGGGRFPAGAVAGKNNAGIVIEVLR